MPGASPWDLHCRHLHTTALSSLNCCQCTCVKSFMGKRVLYWWWALESGASLLLEEEVVSKHLVDMVPWLPLLGEGQGASIYGALATGSQDNAPCQSEPHPEAP